MTFAAFQAHAASGRPVIEIHPVVNCDKDTGSIPFALPALYGGAGCAGRAAIVEGSDVVRARHAKDPRNGEDVLRITFSAKGRRLLFQYTLSHVRGAIAIFVDSRAVVAPIVLEPLHASTFEIDNLLPSEIDALVQRFQPPI